MQNAITLSLRRFSVATMIALMAATLLLPIARANAEEPADIETTTYVDIVGQLIELSSTEAPTTIVVRENPTGEFTDYVVEIDESTQFGTWEGNTTKMYNWIPGDQVRVIGYQNDNTGVVEADNVVNLSIKRYFNEGVNGWITEIDEANSSISVQYAGIIYHVNITENTHINAAGINPATISDLQIDDRVRIRTMESDIENEARIIVVLRRGDRIFLKARTRAFISTLDAINDNGDGTATLNVTLSYNRTLKEGDVNNLVGLAGDPLIINIDENTLIKRRYFGDTTLDEFQVGDELMIVGRVSDEVGADNEAIIDARLVRNADIWRLGVPNHIGVVNSVDTSANEIDVTLRYLVHEKPIIVSYDDETVISKDGQPATEYDLAANDEIRVRGTAHDDGEVITVNANSITARSEGADLVVGRIQIDENGLVTATLTNTGTVDVENDVQIHAFVNGTLEYDMSSADLDNDGFLTAGGVSYITPATVEGAADVTVCVDAYLQAEEINENNNCRTYHYEE